MYSLDVTYQGAPVKVYDPTKRTPVLGVRIVPLLTNPAAVSAAAAYAALVIRAIFLSEFGVATAGVDQQFTSRGPRFFAVDCPGWFAAENMGDWQMTGGLIGQTYRVWVAECPRDLQNPTDSFYPGMSAASSEPLVVVTTTKEFDIALNGSTPSGVQGADLTNAISFVVEVESSDGTSTIDAAGVLGGWFKDASTWARVPEANFQIEFNTDGTKATIIFSALPRPDLGQKLVPFGRLAYRPAAMSLTGGGTAVNITYTVSTQELGTTIATATEAGLVPDASTSNPPTSDLDGVGIESASAIRIGMTANAGTIEPGGEQVIWLLGSLGWQTAADYGLADFNLEILPVYTGAASDFFFDFSLGGLGQTFLRLAARPSAMVLGGGGASVTNEYLIANAGTPPAPNPSAGSLDSRAVQVLASAPTLLGTATAGRLQLSIQNLGTEPIYYGDSGVTVATGTQLVQNEKITLDVQAGAAVYAIAKTTDQVSPDDTRLVEFYQ